MDAVEGLALMHKMKTAYHEAGHVVVALATGCLVRDVVATPAGGRAKVSLVTAAVVNRRKGMYLVCLVAGKLSEELRMLWSQEERWDEKTLDDFWGDFNDDYEFVSSQYARGEFDKDGEKDVDRAALAVERICELREASRSAGDSDSGGCAHAIICEAERVAVDILTAHWDAVDKLARELTLRGSGQLSGEEVCQLIGEMVVPEPQRWLSAA